MDELVKIFLSLKSILHSVKVGTVHIIEIQKFDNSLVLIRLAYDGKCLKTSLKRSVGLIDYLIQTLKIYKIWFLSDIFCTKAKKYQNLKFIFVNYHAIG